jgi:hypothetical protein
LHASTATAAIFFVGYFYHWYLLKRASQMLNIFVYSLLNVIIRILSIKIATINIVNKTTNVTGQKSATEQ